MNNYKKINIFRIIVIIIGTIASFMSIGPTYQVGKNVMIILLFLSGGLLPHAYMLLEIFFESKIDPKNKYLPDIIGIILTIVVGIINLYITVIVMFAEELHNPYIGMFIILIGFVISLICKKITCSGSR